mgnify:CR=1 FL=1
MLRFLANPLGMLIALLAFFAMLIYFQPNVFDWSHNLIWFIIRIGDSFSLIASS